eukprot:14592313-Ditylum_brightwellii.AAC.1
MACVYWSKSTMIKGMHHFTIRENAIFDAIQNNIFHVQHIAGDVNLADMFTEEHKDISHFLTICNQLATMPSSPHVSSVM